MLVATPGNQLIALEAKSGNQLWHYKRPLPEDLTVLHPTNRGVGLFGDKIFFASADAVLVALDARTGKEAWTAKVADYKTGYYMSLMPLIVDGKVMLGASGGEFGVRCFVAAYDAEYRQGGLADPTWCRSRASPAPRPGRRAINGRPAAARSGCRAPTMPKPTSPIGAPRQRRPVDRRSASGRQSLHLRGGGARRQDR